MEAQAWSTTKAYTRQSSASLRTPPLRRAWRCARTRSVAATSRLCCATRGSACRASRCSPAFPTASAQSDRAPFRREMAEARRRLGAPPAKQPRASCKTATILDLIGRNEGATVKELMAATDWLPHRVRGAIGNSAPGSRIRPTASAPQIECQRPAGIPAGPVHPKREQPPAGALRALRARVCQGCR